MDASFAQLRIAVAQRMAEDLDGLVSRMMAEELRSIPELGSDATFVAEVQASNRANAEAVIELLSDPDSAIGRARVRPEAIDVVRTTVRRGLDLELIYRAYRRGQNIVWNDFMTHAGQVVAPEENPLEFLAEASALMFDYIDLVVTQVIAAAQREREEIAGGALARRIETVRLVLDGAPIDLEQGTERLGYDLRLRHTGLVLWSEPGADAHGSLESVALRLARSVDARPPLTIAAGVSALWAWIGTREAPPRGAFASAADLPPEVRVAVGPTREGLGGFRATHAGAVDVHRLVAGRADVPNVALHEDYDVSLLLGRDVRSAAEFVQRILGDLSADTPTADRLRESLRVFLAEGGNAPRTAARLFTHRNTVLQRVDRASTLLGRRPEENRLAVSVALELASHFGSQVLAPKAAT